MSLLLNQPLKLLCFRRKPVLVRSSLMQTPPCSIVGVQPCGADHLGRLDVMMMSRRTCLEKKVPLELVHSDPMVTIGSSHGWVATLKDDGILRLQDDFNPAASDTNPKRIPLPPLVTLPHCQTQIVTNVSMSSSSPEDEDCVVAVKFLGPQLSFCRPAQRKPEWINVRIANPCFYSSSVMYSEKDDMFRIPGSGGHLIGSWDLGTHMHTPKIQKLRFKKFPNLAKTTRKLLDSCCTSEHLVESRSTGGEMFLVKWYKRTAEIVNGVAKMGTEALMVFKLDEQGNAVYTQDIGDLCMYLSKSEPFCVPASSFPGLPSNQVIIYDFDEAGFFFLDNLRFIGGNSTFKAPFHIPPPNMNN
ncbi:unnamed protein product [Arabidopsis thaliana]|uniref:KIB1-4 beta-propeller domain-containing protein n=2 Tax=Arabidopsis TaxID=3701 RepID=Q9FL67_ARATH|nr:hypothetical protein (DUF295) [Arabidopsis thaliana]ABE97197.1 hypothetical protein At5g54330 [Arabidopsis thaliana]AED96485.1 hypothetical protein (DUF295) [Arabidopsis thaliana]KAG7612960.1 hypothetical protein ISN44_As05g049280 [Arabidopsis suecica]BAB10756.1 unnamed protein product [Arabidopsis thaliana]|eukprot:NP_200244.1 hypothetical protein (DUF295) [Arabidopsis thaliana]